MRPSLLVLLSLIPLLGCGSDVSIGKVTVDRDSDGYDETVDCDDARATVNPDAPELCDGLDNDCDEAIDEDAEDASAFYADADADGHGDPASPTVACEAPADAVLTGDDCDDAEPAAFPGNDELCDGLDNDCDGDTDEDAEDVVEVFTDGDGDGFGEDSTAELACAPGPGEVTQGGDCDDDDARFYPGAEETDCADPNDYNCDGSSGFADADADGVPACEDCDDGDAAVNPSATEVCDNDDTDEDCDGLADDDDSAASGKAKVYEDGDGDTYGDLSTSLTVCDAPSGYVTDSTDCDDSRATVNPGATEVCDSANLDEDCDGKADDADSAASGKTTGYADDDGDTYGDPATGTTACDLPAGSVSNSADCDDTDAAINPAAAEVCDSANTDEDCDGKADDSDSSASGKSTWYGDADSDSYGSSSSSTSACDQPSGYVSLSTDCDDTKASVNPGAAEVCDSANTDEDCDGKADDADSAASGKSTAYRDADGDTYGDASSATTVCDLTSGYVSNSTDCDDTKASINPAATEVCDSANTDEDCDGKADDSDTSASGKTTYYRDADGDTYGSSATTSSACDQPSGYVTTSTDCDDTKASVNPAAAEVCDSANTDEDCDGKADDLDTSASGKSTWYRDADGDTYGASTTTSSACDQPSGYVSLSTDCDDTKSTINPAATEVCDSANTDEDCDGKADDLDTSASGKSTVYRDADGDTYGSSATSKSVCDSTSGYVSNDDDCDDSSAAVSPADTEVCDDGIDNDCNGSDKACPGPGYSGVYDVNSGYDTKIYGAKASDSLAETLISGDFNGDGLGDLIVGSSEAYVSASYDGQAFGYYGPFTAGAYEPATNVDFGYFANDVSASTYFGSAAENIGDIDDDGSDDYVIRRDGTNFAYSIYLGGSTTVDDYNTGKIGTFSCNWLATAGDYDGSGGGAEVLCSNVMSSSYAGSVAVHDPYGSSAMTTFTGEAAGNWAGYDLDGGKDVDGDGLDDVLIGSPFNGSSSAGAVYIMYGGVTGTISLGSADVKITGEAAYDAFGALLMMVDDADGDGLDDVLVAGPGNDAGGFDAGAVYLFTAPSSGKASVVAEAKILGAKAGDVLTESAMDMGDVDGDGTLDLVVAGYNHSTSSVTYSGAVWLSYGPISGSIDLTTDADAQWTSAYTNDWIGATMTLIPDADGDGDVEIAIGTAYHDYGTTSTSANQRGAVWIWPGM
jgi:hypothetical protein